MQLHVEEDGSEAFPDVLIPSVVTLVTLDAAGPPIAINTLFPYAKSTHGPTNELVPLVQEAPSIEEYQKAVPVLANVTKIPLPKTMGPSWAVAFLVAQFIPSTDV